FNVADGPQDVDLKVEAPIANGGLQKTGAGLMEIDSATNTYAGLSQVTDGTLRIDGTITGMVKLDGGTLAGVGTVGAISPASSTPGGTIAPGAVGIGTLSSAGDVTLNDLDQYFIDLVGGGGGNTDLLAVTGNIDLGQASLAGHIGAAIAIGEKFTIMQASGDITGQFASGGVAFIDGKKFTIDYQHDISGPGTADRVVLTRAPIITTVTVTRTVQSPVFGQSVPFNFHLSSEAGTSLPTSGLSVVFTLDGVDNTVALNAQGNGSF